VSQVWIEEEGRYVSEEELRIREIVKRVIERIASDLTLEVEIDLGTGKGAGKLKKVKGG